MLKIAHFKLTSPLLQAPMAGVTDRLYRDLVRQHGAGLATSEMITSDLNLLNTRKTQLRLPQMDEDGPRSIQIVGTDPEVMAEAARFYASQGAQMVDINFGCPVKKVAGSKKLAGSALLKDEQQVEQIIRSVVNAIDIPVTIKYRTGWDMKSRNAIRIGQIAEDCGVSALALHGRTREDKYRPFAEYETIRQVKKHVNIPVIANGDISSSDKAAYVFDYTGADGIMIGRGSFGRPWIFAEINQKLFGINYSSELTDEYKCQTAVEHVERSYDINCYNPESKLLINTTNQPVRTADHSRIANKIINWYLLSMSTQTDARSKILSSRTPGEQLSLFKEAIYATL